MIQFDGKNILFWKDNDEPIAAHMLHALFGVLGYPDPREFIRHDIPDEDRLTVALALRLRTALEAAQNLPGGDVAMAYMGLANCRICNAKLGSRDVYGYGFIWPERADHYIVLHKVWTPDCDTFLAAVRAENRAR